MDNRRSWTTPDRVVRLVVWILVAALVYWLVQFFSDLVLLLFIGFVLGYVLNPLVDRLQQFGIGRVTAVIAATLIVVVIFGFVLAFLIPFVGQQASDLSRLLSKDNWLRVARSIETALAVYVPIPEDAVTAAFRRTFDALFEQERLTDTVAYMVGLFTNIVYALIVVPFTMVFVMKEGREFRDFLLKLVPNRYLELTVDLIDKIESNIGAYFRAILVRAIVVSVVVSMLLWVIGLKYAVAVGIFTGIVNTIPYFGPILGFVGGSVVGIAQTGDLALVPGVAIAMAVVQFLDNVLFQPLLFSRASRAHPIVVLCAVLIGAELGGILGMLLSIPILTIANVTTRQILWSVRNYYIFRAV